jgi:hypothetical protein
MESEYRFIIRNENVYVCVRARTYAIRFYLKTCILFFSFFLFFGY